MGHRLKIVIGLMVAWAGSHHATFAADDMLAPSEHTAAVVARIGKDKGVPNVFLLDALPPTTQPADAEVVPTNALREAIGWVRTIVHDDYIPEDMETRYRAYKDVEKLRNVDAQGRAYFRLIGSYLIWFGETRGEAVRVQENGHNVSMMIRLAEPIEIKEQHVRPLLRSGLAKYLKYPNDKIDRLRYVIGESGGVFYGHVTTRDREPDYAALRLSNTPFSFLWWERVWFMTDGKLLFLLAGEGDGKPIEERPNPGYRRRF